MTSSRVTWRHWRDADFRALYLQKYESDSIEFWYASIPSRVIDKNCSHVVMTSSCDFIWITWHLGTFIYFSWTKYGRFVILSTICLLGIRNIVQFTIFVWRRHDVIKKAFFKTHIREHPIVMKLGRLIGNGTRIANMKWRHDDVIMLFLIDFWIFNFSHSLCTQIEGVNFGDLLNLYLYKSSTRQLSQPKDITTVMTSEWRHQVIYCWFLNIIFFSTPKPIA